MKKENHGKPVKRKLQGTFRSFGMSDAVLLEKCEYSSLTSIIPNHGANWYLVLEDEVGSIESIERRNPGDFLHQFRAFKFDHYEDAKWAYDELKQGQDLGAKLRELGYDIQD